MQETSTSPAEPISAAPIPPASPAIAPPTCLRLYLSFARASLFTLGGGAAMLPVVEREVVDARGWMTGKEFVEALAVVYAVPGPVAMNMAVFVGYRTRGVRGALAAAAGTASPPFVVMLLVVAFLLGWKDAPAVTRMFAGLRPAVAGLIAAAAWRLGSKAAFAWWGWLLLAATGLVTWRVSGSAICIVAAAALLGALFFRPKPEAPA